MTKIESVKIKAISNVERCVYVEGRGDMRRKNIARPQQDPAIRVVDVEVKIPAGQRQERTITKSKVTKCNHWVQF